MTLRIFSREDCYRIKEVDEDIYAIELRDIVDPSEITDLLPLLPNLNALTLSANFKVKWDETSFDKFFGKFESKDMQYIHVESSHKPPEAAWFAQKLLSWPSLNYFSLFGYKNDDAAFIRNVGTLTLLQHLTLSKTSYFNLTAPLGVSLAQLPHLTWLSLSNSLFHDMDPLLSRSYLYPFYGCTSLEYLNLNWCWIGDVNAKALALSFAAVTQLTHLELSHNYLTTTDSMKVMYDILTRLPRLHTLNWSTPTPYNHPNARFPSKAIAPAFPMMAMLTHLEFEHFPGTIEDEVALIEAVAQCTSLTYADLASSHEDVRIYQAIIDVIPQMPAIVTYWFFLSDLPFKSTWDGFRAALQRTTTLCHFGCKASPDHNEFSDHVRKPLQGNITRSRTLQDWCTAKTSHSWIKV